MKTKFKLVFYFFFALPCFLYSQWQSDIRLTNNAGQSYLCSNNSWSIAASGDVLHVTWSDNRDGNNEIYYKRSTNAGVSWGTDTRLTVNSWNSALPCIAVSGGIVLVSWNEDRDGNKEIYYKRSTNGGAS